MTGNRVYKTKAVVLKQMPLGETDRIITFYTRSLGKVAAVARGVRRPGSKFGGSLEILNHVQASIARGRSLDNVNECVVIESYKNLRKHLTAIAEGIYIAELVDTFGEDRSPNFSLFDILLETLSNLDRLEHREFWILWFEFRLLHVSGFLPEFVSCVECRNGLDRNDHIFDPVAGGVLCPDCVNNYGTDQSWSISVSALTVLRFFQRSLNLKLQSDSSDPYVDDLSDAKVFLRIYMRYIAERDLKSTGFLDLVRFKESY
tara:strand:+ start:1119 stop:1898 length:780 start_codon:yes stop_codon:yes gene_type:complete